MSRVAIVGGHGQIALLLTQRLAADGHEVVSVVRNPDHTADVNAAGGSIAVVDLETDPVEVLADAIRGADAVVFAAGAGPGSGAARKWTVDKGGALTLIDACNAAGIDRYVMVSAMGTDDPPAGEEVFAQYLRAKAEADQALVASDLDWTIIRPGRLTDGPPTGQVAVARHVPRGEVTRADVADVLRTVIVDDRLSRQIVELVGGTDPIDTAIDAVEG